MNKVVKKFVDLDTVESLDPDVIYPASCQEIWFIVNENDIPFATALSQEEADRICDYWNAPTDEVTPEEESGQTPIDMVDKLIEDRSKDKKNPLGWYAYEYKVICHVPNIGDQLPRINLYLQKALINAVHSVINGKHTEVAVFGPLDACPSSPGVPYDLRCSCDESPCWHQDL